MNRSALIPMMILAGLSGQAVWAQTKPAPGPRTAQSTGEAYLTGALADFERTPGLRVASWGFVAMDARTGQVLASRYPDRSLAPASTQKLLTTGAALSVLGPNYRVRTRLYYRGRISRDTLYGSLMIQGQGDPSLGTNRFGPAYTDKAIKARWRAALAAKGIRHIKGVYGTVGPETIQRPLIPGGYTYADMGSYFGTFVSDFSYGENYDSAIFQTGAPGSKAKAIRLPGISDEATQVNVTAGPAGSGDQTYYYDEIAGNIYQGTLPPNRERFTVKVVPRQSRDYLDGPLFDVIRDMLIDHAYASFPGPIDPKQDVLIDELESPTVAQIVEQTNLNSLNLHAETLLRWMGIKERGEGSLEAGLAVLESYWRKQGLPAEGLMLTDGSGLSQSNSASPRHLAQALRASFADPATGPIMRASLPLLGQSGTLKTLGAGSPAAGRLRAKSGTLTRVLCYAGSYTEASGRPVVFAVMVNRYSGTFEDMRRAMGSLLIKLGSQ